MDYNILVSTKDLSRKDWLRYRQLGIGGSDVPGILSRSGYSSPYKVYLEKTRLITDEEPEIDNEAMRQGRDFEQYCADRFEEATGKKVRRVNAIIQHVDYPFIIANIDRRVDGENAILECKTTNAYNAQYYENGDVPLAYKLQCHHYMLATGADKCYLAVLILGVNVVIHEIVRDEEVMQNLLEREVEFWECVTNGTPPPFDGSPATTEILKEANPAVNVGTEISLDANDYSRIQQFATCNKLIKQLEQQREEQLQYILDRLGEAEFGVYDGQIAVKRKWINGRESIDTRKLKAEKPDVYEQYKKLGVGYAKLTIQGEGDN